MTVARSGPLLSIIALARSGSLDRARRLFRESGLEAVTDDAATLSVLGRLLKDEARMTSGPTQADLWRRAGDAYARAAVLSGATYHLINAATLALLSGDRADAADRARRVLDILDKGEAAPETPYYLAATRAEALLLLGQIEAARLSLQDAVQRAPEAWEDHASTLRQFRLVLETLGEDAAWLTPLQPPRSLHFAGTLALAGDSELTARIGAVLEAERIGFAYGALAGGADLIVSEAVLARGAELHLVLPAAPAVFRAESAAPLGGDWPARFDAVLDRAVTVSVVQPDLSGTTMLHVRLAAEVAMGKAAMNAAMMASEAVQLLLSPAATDTGATAAIGERWRASDRRQICLDAARQPPPEGQVRSLPEAPPAGVLAAILAVAIEPTGGTAPDTLPVLDRIGAALAGTAGPIIPPVVGGNTLHLAFADPAQAADAAVEISRASLGTAVRIAGHYGVVDRIGSPFGSGSVLTGAAAAVAPDILASVPDGAIHLSEAFATSLNAWRVMAPGTTSYVGDLTRAGETLALYALSPSRT